MHRTDESYSTSRDENPIRGQKTTFCGRSVKLKRLVAGLGPNCARFGVKTATLGFATFFLCHCHRQPSTATSTPTPIQAPIPASTPMATTTPTLTPAPAATSSTTPRPTVTPANTPSPPQPALSPTPDSFEEGLKHVLQATGSGFLELRGKFIKVENGSGSYPLFRSRKIYEGTFVFGGATSAELEEVYYSNESQPAYNYRLYYQALSSKDSIERYVDLRQRLNQLLQGFDHTYGDRYDAWARADPLKTAILLSIQELPGSLQIQVHAAFASPQW
jgi:hypothetical protein